MWKTERRVVLWFFGLALLASIAYFIRAASTTEDGWKFVGDSVSEAAYGWFPSVVSVPANSDSYPDELADFWMKEIDRITAANPDSAEITMGCALFLHSNSGLEVPFISSHGRPRQIFKPDIDFDKLFEEMDEKKKRFGILTKDRCLELAKLATELEPKNKNWWRLRAVLLFSDPLGSEIQARTDDWENILKEIATHDSDNALYDYLAAKMLWNDNIDFEEIEGTEEYRTIIKDRKLIDRGLIYFRSGLKKKYLSIASENAVDVKSLAKKTSLETIDHVLLVSSIEQTTFFQTSYNINHVAGNCHTLAEFHKDHAEPKKALQLYRDLEAFRKQRRIHNEQDIPRLAEVQEYLTTKTFLKLEKQFPGTLDENEKKALQEKLPALKMETHVYNMALGNLSRDISLQGNLDQMFASMTAYTVSTPFAILAIYGVAIGLLFGAIHFVCNGFSFSQNSPMKLGVFRHLGIWLLVFIVSAIFYQKFIDLSRSQMPPNIFLVHPFLWIFSLVLGGVALVRACSSSDRYHLNHPRRTLFTFLWFLLLLISMAILWISVSLCREILVTGFLNQPAFFIAGWMFAIILLGEWVKLISEKSKNPVLKENETRLGIAFAILVPTSLLMTFVIRLPFFLGYEWKKPLMKGLLGFEGTLGWIFSELDNFSEENIGGGVLSGWGMLHGSILLLFFVSILVGLRFFWLRKREIDSSETTSGGDKHSTLWSPMFRTMATSTLALGLIGLFLWTLAMPLSMQLPKKFDALLNSGLEYPYEHKLAQFEEMNKIKADDRQMNGLRELAEIEKAEEIERQKKEAAKIDCL